MNNDNLKLIYSYIIQGSSSFLLDGKICYIKHLSALDSSIVDIKKQEYFDSAKNAGVPTHKEKFDEIIDKKLWTMEKEARIQEIKDYLVNLKHTKSKYSIKKDIIPVEKEIEKYNIQLLDLIIEKDKLMGRTAEFYADKKISEYYIYISLYSDAELKKRLFTEEQFSYLDNDELTKINKIYNDKVSLFNDSNLKKISLMPYFMNLLILAENSLRDLFGKPLIELTFYQIDLIQYGNNFKNILQNSKTQPDAVTMADPNKLIDWFDRNKNLEKIINEGDTPQDEANKQILSDNKSIVGMTREEIKAANIDTSMNDKIKDALKKKGGELSMRELMELEGHKMG